VNTLIGILTIVAAFIGVPLFAVFGGASMAFFSNTDAEATSGVSPIYWAGNEFFTHRFADSNLTVTIPMFIFAGYLLAESGAPRRLVRLSQGLLGWLPGGLPIVCVAASAFFTTFTGGSGITIVAIGGLLLPALLASKYDERFSLGLVTTGGSLGLLFPPSIPIILYAIIANIEIADLFMAGLLPGILTLAVIGAYSMYVDSKAKRERPPFRSREALAALNEAKWEVFLPIAIVLGLLTGLLRIHEASVFAAAYAFVIEVWVYKDLSIRRDIPRIVRESTTMFGAILAILATAIGFTGFLIDAKVPDDAANLLGDLVHDPFVFLLVLNLFLLVVGMFMDVFSATVVVVPLILPIAARIAEENPENAINPFHLGIVFLLNLEIGYLTPPVGLNLFISAIRFDKPITYLYRTVLPFMGLLLFALLVTTYLPLFWPGFLLVGDDESQQIDLDGNEPGDPVPDDFGGGDTLDDLGGETLDDLGGETLDDLGGETLDDLDGPTLDDLEEPTLDDVEEPTLDDLGEPPAEPTLDDLEGTGGTPREADPAMDAPPAMEEARDQESGAAMTAPTAMTAPAMTAPAMTADTTSP
jgi:tripartite ATP-independent transporter DctM subunit